MNKDRLKKTIIDLVNNVGIGVAMLTLAVAYLTVLLEGEGYWFLFVCDVICGWLNLHFAVKEWKRIKQMLAD